MKYIRTKDGIFETPKTMVSCDVKMPLNVIGYYIGEIILSQADTIEELCDVYVVIDKTTNYHTVDKYPYDIIINGKEDYEIYGAIWTNKGLIYVAKINDKGELELL